MSLPASLPTDGHPVGNSAQLTQDLVGLEEVISRSAAGAARTSVRVQTLAGEIDQIFASTRNIQATLEGASAGLSSSATYKSLASVGVTNQSNGTIYLNTYTFQNAMNTDPASVQSLFTFSGSSTSPAVTVNASTSCVVNSPSVQLGGSSGTMHYLCDERLLTWLRSHTHGQFGLTPYQTLTDANVLTALTKGA